jgi:hypothetical protein
MKSLLPRPENEGAVKDGVYNVVLYMISCLTMAPVKRYKICELYEEKSSCALEQKCARVLEIFS